MIMSPDVRHNSTAGFTLLEALIATALMAMILAALATITGQWLPNWNRGVVRVQGSEQVGRALERILEDLAAAEFISAGTRSKRPLFEGTPTAVVFVRTATGPNATIGLDVIRLAQVATDDGPVLLRTRSPFVPNSYAIADLAARVTREPVVVLRMPLQVTFSYAGPDSIWHPTWRSAQLLPSAIRMNVINNATNSSVSAATFVHATVPVDCVTAKSLAECLASDTTERPKAL